jgi:hypothetical protein
MQHELQVHALVHAGGALHRAHEQGLQSPAADVSCLSCSLLAGGSSAAAPNLPSSAPPMAALPHALGAIVWRSLTAPSYYSSRAPPPLL